MNILAFLTFCALSNYALASSPCKSSQTFMFTRPIEQNIGATRFLWSDIIADEERGENSIRILPMFQKSISNCKNNGYFSINCKQNLRIAGDATDYANKRDIRAEWFGLPDSYQAIFSLEPHQKQWGVVLSLHHHLRNLGWAFFEHSWIEITAPIVKVTNRLCINQRQATIAGQTASPSLLINALNNPSFNFAAITGQKQCLFGLAELRCLFGTTLTYCNDFLVSYYTGLIFPTSKKHNPHFLFSPVLGTDGHWGLIAGINLELPLQPEACSDYALKLFICAENDFLLHNKELRTFDLRNKPWSRYLPLRKKGEITTVPAVNVFTQCVKVHAYSLFNFVTGFKFEHRCFVGEVGYQLWAHPTECVEFLRPSCEGKKPRIDLYAIAGSGTSSACRSTIAQQASNDTTFKKLHRSMLSRKSGSGRGAFTQGAHLALGYRTDHAFIGLGASYEQPRGNEALEQWSIWVTAGSHF